MDLYIADDSSLVRKLLVQLTATHGFTPKVVSDGGELWDVLTQLPPKSQFLALIDWEMPGHEGPSLCKMIRERFTQNPPYVILLTARGAIDDVVGGLRSGANDYVTKPFREEELLARIEVGTRALNMQTQLNQMSLKLIQAEKMASVGQLAAGAAHEVNNPLGFVKSNIETLQGYVSDLLQALEGGEGVDNKCAAASEIDMEFLKEDLGELFNDTRSGIARVQQIVSSLEQFAHAKQPISSEVVLEKVIPTAISANRTYRVDIAKLPNLIGDADELAKLFHCLIENAVWATAEKGDISIRGRLRGEWIEIDVVDTGRGIPDNLMQKIFDPFYTSRPVGEGTGLGLTAAFNIARRHGGSIEVKSREGKGAIFTVKLPRT